MEKGQVILFVCVFAVILITASSKSIENDKNRDKRASSDQRVAELQALIALSRGSGLVGHGHIDPFMAGKRKRAELLSALNPTEKDRLLGTLIERILAAQANEDS